MARLLLDGDEAAPAEVVQGHLVASGLGGGEEFYLSRFVDYSGADGLFRKYRVVLIAGVPYICHFAISKHWMIHYLNAGMAESLEKREQEAECMLHFDEEFATRHRAALAAINQRIGLEYVGIDCAETRDGELLIFEIDNAMIVHGMDPVDMYAYKKPIMQKVFTAFRALLGKPARVRIVSDDAVHLERESFWESPRSGPKRAFMQELLAV